MDDTTAIQTDAGTTPADAGIDFDPADAFLRNLIPDGASPSEGEKEGKGTPAPDAGAEEPQTTEDAPETDAQTAEPDPDAAPENTETTPAAPGRQAADDDEVIVQVGEEAKRVSVKDLKRLFGQEASLTQKHQQASELRKQLDTESQRYAAGLNTMAQAAEANWQQYAGIDFAQAQNTLPPDTFAKLREDATKAWQTHQFFVKGAGEFGQQMQQRQQAIVQQMQQACDTALSDPAKGIPGWGPQMRQELVDFAVSLGGDANALRMLHDPLAFRVMALAQKQVKAEKAAAAARPARPAVPASPARAAPATKAPEPAPQVNKRAAMDRLRGSGDVDDAAAAFLASF